MWGGQVGGHHQKAAETEKSLEAELWARETTLRTKIDRTQGKQGKIDRTQEWVHLMSWENEKENSDGANFGTGRKTLKAFLDKGTQHRVRQKQELHKDSLKYKMFPEVAGT